MSVVAKWALAALLTMFAGLSALTGEAASSAEAGKQAARSLRLAPSDAARLRITDLAIERIETSWARPLRWHAGAAETLSALYGARFDLNGGQANLERSRDLSVVAVTLAPVQPNAWTRLAHLGQAGIANNLCTPAACIAKSYQAARMQEAEAACARLRIAAAIAPIDAQDQRVSDFAITARSTRQVAGCLSFLPESDLFRLVLSHRRGA